MLGEALLDVVDCIDVVDEVDDVEDGASVVVTLDTVVPLTAATLINISGETGLGIWARCYQ